MPSDILYRNYHAFPQINTDAMRRKAQFWAKNQTSNRSQVPNVVIIGIDSTSRLNFIRQMPKTKKLLENLGAIQFLGFTKG